MITQLLAVLREPFPVGLLGGKTLLDLLVVQHLAGRRIEADHLARGEAPLLFDARVVEIDHANFRADGEDTIGGQLVARRAQPIAVEARCNLDPVSKDERRRTVPWLGETTVKLVECLLFFRSRRVDTPGWWHQHGHRMGDIATR